MKDLEETKLADLADLLTTANNQIKVWPTDAAVGRRVPTRDRVAAFGAHLMQTRPGGLGYDL